MAAWQDAAGGRPRQCRHGQDHGERDRRAQPAARAQRGGRHGGAQALAQLLGCELAHRLGQGAALPAVVDLGQPLLQERLGVPTGALATIDDLQQLADLAQPQPDPLGALDQPQPVAWS